jgi:multidrug efflux pump subunit AcrA (membrane-fusion protein)
MNPKQKKRRVRVDRVLTVVVLTGGLAAGYRYYRTPAGRQIYSRAVTLVAAKQPDEVFVPTTVVRNGSFDVSLVAVGALKSKESRTVVSDAFGTVVWTVEDGTRVKKGDPILEIQNDLLVRQLQDKDTALANAKQKLEDTKRDRTLEWENANTQYLKGQQELEILKTQSKSAVEQAKAQLEYQNTELAMARVTYSKNARLAEEKLVPQTQADSDKAAVTAKEFAYQKAEGDLNLQKGKLASDELQKKQEVDRLKFAADMAKGRIDSEVKNAQLNVDTTKKQREDLVDQIKKSVVSAPAGGIVILATRWEDSGVRPMRPGDPVGKNQKVCEMPDLSHMQVTLEVEQKDIGPVRLGLPVRIKLDPFPRPRLPRPGGGSGVGGEGQPGRGHLDGCQQEYVHDPDRYQRR